MLTTAIAAVLHPTHPRRTLARASVSLAGYSQRLSPPCYNLLRRATFPSPSSKPPDL